MKTLAIVVLLIGFSGMALAGENPDGPVGQKWLDFNGSKGLTGKWNSAGLSNEYEENSYGFGFGFVASKQFSFGFGLIWNHDTSAETRDFYSSTAKALSFRLHMRLYL